MATKVFSRRKFLRTSLTGGAAIAFVRPSDILSSFGQNIPYRSKAALTTGNDRADIVFRALKPFSDQIRRATVDKRIVLKPNNVSTETQLAATHVDTLEGILEFLKSVGRTDNVIIAESSAANSTLDGFGNFGYYSLASRYHVKLVDLDQEAYKILNVFNEKDFRPHPVRMSSLLLDQNSYVVSVAKMKTHDMVVATLSLKNIVIGAPIKDKGYSYSTSAETGAKSDKRIAHGGGIRAINYNLFTLSEWLHPDLAVIDGFEGMQGNGPVRGEPVNHRVCVASTDWLSADRIAVELMGINFDKIGYLNYCASAGRGVADLEKIEIIGESIRDHRKSYRLSDNINDQLVWMNPA